MNKLKIRKKSSKRILTNRINEEQKQFDKNAILQRIKNKGINHEINRNIKTITNSKIINKNVKQNEIEKTLNEIKILNKTQQNQFSF